MDAQTLFNAVVSLASVLGGVMLKSIYDAITSLREEDGALHDRINSLPGTYMRRDDFLNFASDIKETLHRIESKIDGKADK